MTEQSKLAKMYYRRLMKKRLIFLIAICIFLSGKIWSCSKSNNVAQPAITATQDYARYNNQVFTCNKVVDGDTIDVNLPDLKSQKPKAFTRIRMWGIDTPEIEHYGRTKPAMYYGHEATEFALKLMAGKKVRLELIEGKTRDKFGRLLAYVFLPDGRLYNELAISEGYAYAEWRFDHPRMEKFMQLEADARDNRRGFWPGLTPDQLPKWYKQSKLKSFWTNRVLLHPVGNRKGAGSVAD